MLPVNRAWLERGGNVLKNVLVTLRMSSDTGLITINADEYNRDMIDHLPVAIFSITITVKAAFAVYEQV